MVKNYRRVVARELFSGAGDGGSGGDEERVTEWRERVCRE